MRRPYYIFSSGRLRRKNNTLLLEKSVTNPHGSTEAEVKVEKIPFPVEQVESLYLFGEIDLNTKFIAFLAQHGIPMFCYDYFGNYTATVYPRDYLLSGRLKIEQARHYLSRRRRMAIAKALVAASVHNILRVLKYYSTRLDGADAALLQNAISDIGQRYLEIDSAVEIHQLMGVEGSCRERYYRTWPIILGEASHQFRFERRDRRPPSNELNALISFGNALCYSSTLRQIYRTALDPTLSFLHEPGERRFSLALDLSEVFKPLLVDRAIFRLVKTRVLKPKHFEERLGGVYLKQKGREMFVEHWDARLRNTIQHRSLNRRVSYERLIRLECYRLIRHLFDSKSDPYEGFRMWR